MSSTNNANEIDQGKLRTLLTNVLNNAASKEGHTLLSYDSAIAKIFELEPPQENYFQAIDIDNFSEFLEEGNLYINRKGSYVKLKKYQEYKETIENIVNSRIRGSLSNQINWMVIIDERYGDLETRLELAYKLLILETSRISLLLGKDQINKLLLILFASIKEINDKSILVLTQTGKAKAQLENSFKDKKIKADCLTVAQFLKLSGAFDENTLSIKDPSSGSKSKAETIIIYESSRLSEVELASLFKLIDPHAKRIILAGDPNLPPPIRAGRPFLDMIDYFEIACPEKVVTLANEIESGIERDDYALAQMFTNSGKCNNKFISRIHKGQTDNHLKFIKYWGKNKLREIFFEELTTITNMLSSDDIDGFNKSLGAEKRNNSTYYSSANHLNEWQILTLGKHGDFGNDSINKLIHKKYRQDIVDNWNNSRWVGPKPQTDQNIVFGDKVIPTENEPKQSWGGTVETAYVYNGEAGIMVDYPYNGYNNNTEYYKFRFLSCDGIISYKEENFFSSSNSSETLELAYSILITKAQGSQFDKTIVVINGDHHFLSREILYTAFTRHTDKLTIISDLSIYELIRYANDSYSKLKIGIQTCLKTRLYSCKVSVKRSNQN
jgi:ATP-dependent exoDNAse (exonuclease V) alpha subunit